MLIEPSRASLLTLRIYSDYALLAEKELPEERVLLRKVIVPIVLFIALSSTVAHVRCSSDPLHT